MRSKKERAAWALLVVFALAFLGYRGWELHLREQDEDLARTLGGSGIEVTYRHGRMSITATPKSRSPKIPYGARNHYRPKNNGTEQERERLSSLSAAVLEKALGFHELHTLNLTGEALSDAIMPSVIELVREKGITTIGLHGTRITDTGFEQLAGLGLQSVLLGRNLITDDGIEGMGNWTSLQNVSFYQGAMSDATLEAAQELRQLKTINLIGKSVNAGPVERLRSALPGCEVKVHVSEVLEDEPSSKPQPKNHSPQPSQLS